MQGECISVSLSVALTAFAAVAADVWPDGTEVDPVKRPPSASSARGT